jgi:alkyldihydroxyacetonephosphate synthase
MFEWLWTWWASEYSSPSPKFSHNSSTETRIIPEQEYQKDDGEESLDVWGFKDTQFQADENGIVEVTGARYPLSGQKLPSLLPWISKLMEVEISGANKYESNYPPAIPESIINEDFLSSVRAEFEKNQLCWDSEQRLRHGHGHSQKEMFAIKHGHIARVPDLIIYPRNEEQVATLVQAAVKYNISLVPYGGGTNVSEALECPRDEKRMIVSLDMKEMNRILWIDPTNRMACIEAGAVGRHIMENLAKEGFTMGHEPDSIEFSTLGGWIATNASGMKKNKYGNIEDLVLDMTVVTANGILQRSEVLPRESIGVDPRALIFGSEGSLGVITSATVKLFPLPEVQRYGSVLFPTFEDGVAFMYALTQANGQPASIRLVDNTQFQLSMALKPSPTPFASVISQIQKFYITKIRGFDPFKMVACTLVFEGTSFAVSRQESTLYTLAANHGGIKSGSENGERGYLLTYNIAYIRDFGVDHYVLAESFETSIPWSNVLTVCSRVKSRIQDEHSLRKLPGKPFVTCRVTQVYETGVAVYFYFAYCFLGVEEPDTVFGEVERAARQEILECGGALSHHHGVGSLRRGFLGTVLGDEGVSLRRGLKEAVDPKRIFGVGNLDEINFGTDMST